MDSDNHQQQPQLGYGLLRFRSAPGLETEKFDSRFMNYGSSNNNSGSSSSSSSSMSLKESPVVSPRGYSALPPHYPRPSSAMGSSSSMDLSSYRLVGSTPMAVEEHHPKSVITSNLMRQSSSPSDLFISHLPSHNQNGYGTMRGTGNFRGGSGFINRELSPPSNRLKGGQSNFSSGGLPSSLGILSQISELGNDSSSRFSGPGFPFSNSSWSDSSNFSEGLLKREDENHDVKMFSTSMNGEIGNRHPMISHRTMSLPRTLSDMAAMEKFLQLQDSVPCKIRAKRGCATHPRSIAERVRRTRISERMRKLQELVPNMDKQTNTSDMLDLAVDYIKDLQKQFKNLSDSRANCKCLTTQKPVLNQHA